MIHCPKCEFEQPKIEYCASCGVHIDTYAAKKPPLGQRITKNAFTHLFLLFVVVLGTILFVKNNWKLGTGEGISFQPASVAQNNNLNLSQFSETQEFDFDRAEEAARSLSSENPVEPMPEETNVPYILVELVEIPINSLAYYNTNFNLDSLKQASVVSVASNVETSTEATADFRRLYQNKYYVNALQKPLRIQQSVFDESIGDELGFIIDLKIQAVWSNRIEILLDLDRHFYISNTQNTALWQRLNESLTFENGQKKLIQGILPQRPPHENERNLFQTGYLSLMLDELFIENETTLSLFLTYYTDKTE